MSETTTELERHWATIIREQQGAQGTIARKRTELKRSLVRSERLAQLATERGMTQDAAYLRTRLRWYQTLLEQLELLDQDVVSLAQNITAVTGALEAKSLEGMGWRLRLKQINAKRLESLLRRDLEAAIAGRPAPKGLPQAWMRDRGRLATNAAWAEALRAWALDYPEVQEVEAAALAGFEEFAGAPASPGQLAGLKALNLPTIMGLHYRLEAHVRALPEGEAWLDALKLGRLTLSVEERKALESAEKPSRLTDRLGQLFKSRFQ